MTRCLWRVRKFTIGRYAHCQAVRPRVWPAGPSYFANQILEVIRKMFSLAEPWGPRTDGGNPCRFVQKYKEKRRERFLSDEEFQRLGRVLARRNPDAALGRC